MRNLITTIALVPCLLAALAATAQRDSSLELHQDPRVELLIKKQVEINELNTREARRFVPGFRILLCSTPDRNKANQLKAKAYRYFPELRSYLVFQASFFKLKLGNFKEQQDAEAYLVKVKPFFGEDIYVVRDQIEVNPDRSGQLEIK